MIRLPDLSPDQAHLATLQGYQAEVDAAADYAAQVAEAKRLFSLRNKRENATFAALKRTLTEMCSGVRRCVYCEDSLADEVEHIKPKDLYPEAVFHWPNYVYACGPCNGTQKGGRFAVLDVQSGEVIDVTRKRGAPLVPPRFGDPALINPRAEDPMRFLQLDLIGTFTFVPRRELSDRERRQAEYTLGLLFRDRDDLPLTHRAAFQDFLAHLRAYTKQRLEGAAPDELQRLQGEILGRRNPTVWREMQRQHDCRPDLEAAFQEEPEALRW